MKLHPSTYQSNNLKFIPFIVIFFFVLIILLNFNSTIFKKYTCNNLTNSALDTNIFNSDSTINLMNNKNLAIKANKTCIKQLLKDKNNPQFNFQVAYTYLALKDYISAKKYLDKAIDKKYPAALYYSAIANDNEWIDYENGYNKRLIEASKSNYFAKYLLGYNYLTDAWYEDDPELSKKDRNKAIKLFKEIDFFHPAKNLLLIEEIKNDILNYNKVKKLSDEIDNNTVQMIEEYKRHGYNFATDSLYDLSIELTNNGYSNLAIKYIPKVIAYSQERNKSENFTQEKIIYDEVFINQLLAFALYNTGKLNKSEEYWIKAINLIQNHKEVFIDDPAIYANSLNNFGLNYMEMGERELALKLFRQSSKEYDNLNDNTLWSLMPLANISIFTYDDKEREALSKNLFNNLVKRKVNLKVYVRPITTLIYHYVEKGDVDNAKKVYQQLVSTEDDERNTDPVSRYDEYLINIIHTRILTLEKKYEEAIKKLNNTNDLLEDEKFLDFTDYNSLKLLILENLIEVEDFYANNKLSNIINEETSLLSSKILNYIESSEDFTDEKIKEITGFSSGLLLDLKRKIKNNIQIDNKDFKIIQLLSMTEVDFSSFSIEQQLKGKNGDQLKKLQILSYELKILKKKFSTTKNINIKNSIKKIENEKKKILKDIGIKEKIGLNFYSLKDFKDNLKLNESFIVFLESNESNRLDENILIRIFFDGKSISMSDLSDEYEGIKLNIKKTLNSVKIDSWPPQDFATIASNNLFEALFKNIDLEKIENDNLLIKNNGLISTIPFNILVKDYYNNPKNYDDISWVIDENTIINIASFKYFFENKKNKLISKTFLGVGNPNFKKENKIIKIAKIDNNNEFSKIMSNRSKNQNSLILDQLPETEDEIRSIAKFFLKKNYSLFISKEASETKIKKENLKNFSYIIFATHAIPESSSKNSDLSGLALNYPDKTSDFDNGFLNVKEIMKLNLNSDLVLLSACETATDDQASGRAFSGMVNSFFFAGSNSVIASHWKIESSSTVLITTSFFENLIDKKNNTAESLRNSILNFRENNKEFNHPAFWGAFSIVLNSRQI